jgi:hypothetical protein
MRLAFISTAAALTVLTSVSVGYAQNNQSPPTPAAKQQQAYQTTWPTAAQEAAIPYRPCETAIGWTKRHLICWNQ